MHVYVVLCVYICMKVHVYVCLCEEATGRYQCLSLTQPIYVFIRGRQSLLLNLELTDE